MADWPYNTGNWQRLRLAKLASAPLCEPCERSGRITPAKHVDHIVSIASGGPAFPELSGLMSMCPSCHGFKTANLDRRGGKGLRFKGCGLDGLPIDPSHPANGYTPSKDEELSSLVPSSDLRIE